MELNANKNELDRQTVSGIDERNATPSAPDNREENGVSKHPPINIENGNENGNENSLKMDNDEGGNNSDDFSTGDTEEVGVNATKIKTNTVNKGDIEKAKQKLSKWSLRLFDPNRPKGIVETPSIIPLNDEFITAFGNREKEYDKSIGRTIELDRENLDVIEIDSDDDEEDEDAEHDLAVISQQKGGSCKVSFRNLAYTTSQKVLEEECEKYGSTIDVNLVMDMEKALRNSTIPMSVGRAYVTFLDAESASKCAEALNEKLFDKRIIRVRLVVTKTPFQGNTQSKKSLKRYWEKDLSTKCFRCRRIGHTEAECTFEEKPRPCHLCGSTEHQHRLCPISTICFNCGIPGHVSRNCILPKGIPRRIVCTYCYQSGHHRMACRSTCPNNLFSQAKCITCPRQGHFVCSAKDRDWISSRANGVYCFNCGAEGHIGYDCKRPKVESCTKESDISMKEIDRAWSLSDKDESSDRYQSSKRGRPFENNYQQSKRAKSAPPPAIQRRNFNSYRDEEPSPVRQNDNSSRNRGHRAQSSHSNKNNSRDRNQNTSPRSQVMSATYDPRSEKVSYSNYSTYAASRRHNNSRGYR